MQVKMKPILLISICLLAVIACSIWVAIRFIRKDEISAYLHAKYGDELEFNVGPIETGIRTLDTVEDFPGTVYTRDAVIRLKDGRPEFTVHGECWVKDDATDGKMEYTYTDDLVDVWYGGKLEAYGSKVMRELYAADTGITDVEFANGLRLRAADEELDDLDVNALQYIIDGVCVTFDADVAADRINLSDTDETVKLAVPIFLSFIDTLDRYGLADVPYITLLVVDANGYPQCTPVTYNRSISYPISVYKENVYEVYTLEGEYMGQYDDISEGLIMTE